MLLARNKQPIKADIFKTAGLQRKLLRESVIITIKMATAHQQQRGKGFLNMQELI